MIEINEHDIRYVDMRPIKGKRVPTCLKCGIADNKEVQDLIKHYEEITTSDLQGCVDVIAKRYGFMKPSFHVELNLHFMWKIRGGEYG